MSKYIVKPSKTITEEYEQLIHKLMIAKTLFEGNPSISMTDKEVERHMSIIQDSKRVLSQIERDTQIKIYQGEVK